MQKLEFDTTLTHLWIETFPQIEPNEVLNMCELWMQISSMESPKIPNEKFATTYQIDSVVWRPSSHFSSCLHLGRVDLTEEKHKREIWSIHQKVNQTWSDDVD